MPLQATSGAASYDGFGGGAAAAVNYIEDMFSTFLYTGNGSTQTITNGIDLSTKGGLTWIKYRDGVFGNGHYLYDTVRGAGKALRSNLTDAETAADSRFTSFNSNGFSLDVAGGSGLNANTYPFVSWTFREQAKFFDVVTWTGTGVNRTIAHALGSVPACIMVKRTDTTANWAVYHRSLANTQYLVLNDTAAAATGATWWNSTTPTSTVFSLGTDASVNASGGTYVAYIFAHDAGGFGLAGTDNVISCGSVSATGATPAEVNLGYEPQWLLIKGSNIINGWSIIDNMRGFTADKGVSWLQPNTSAAEVASPTTPSVYLTSTGFKVISTESPLNGTGTYIYIAIRRGPMKVPTLGTSVFGMSARSGTGANATVTGSAGVTDAALIKNRGSAVGDLFASRLTGTGYLETSSTATEVAAGTTILQAIPWDVMDGVKVGTTSTITNASANTFINYLFKRAPSVFDVVCYTGTGSLLTLSHNLGVAPELVINKTRSTTWPWIGTYNFTSTTTDIIFLDSDAAKNSTQSYGTGAVQYSSQPTATSLFLATNATINTASQTQVVYLFATCAGVSKVGGYTGNGTTQTINCGFGAGGARFVLIKRTDSTGGWYVYDTVRGMTALTDPYLLANSTAAEVATLGSVTTVSTGFAVNATILAAINTNAATYIFLAFA